MTLSTLRRYDDGRMATRDGRAIVVGGSIAGLCAARVLADRFSQVTVLERDELPDRTSPRRGVPQGLHAHTFHRAGLQTVEDLLPGYGESLVAAGGVRTDLGGDWSVYSLGEALADTPTRLPTVVASRPLFEQVLRRRVADLDPVRIRPSHHCREYLTDGIGETVRGVRVRNAEGRSESLPADLVVDATGRTSRTPAWLEQNGYDSPPTSDVQVDVAYSTVLIERPPDDRRAIQVVGSPRHSREAIALPIEGDRWVVVLVGRGEDHPPTDPGDLVSFAGGLGVPDIRDLLVDHALLSRDVHHYRFPTNRRRRYEKLDALPGGVLVMGDALASFNPVYGQGMSVAALEALVLHHTLADGRLEDIGRRFFERVHPVVDVPWFLALAFDSGFPETSGRTSEGTDTFGEYMAHLVSRAHSDGQVAEALLRVVQLERAPASLLRPAIVRRVFDTGDEEGLAGTGRDGWETQGALERFLEGRLEHPAGVRSWPGSSSAPQAASPIPPE